MSKRIRGCYLHYCDVMDPEYSLTGVDRKVLAQIKAFNDAGIDCAFRYCSHPKSFLGKAISCLPFMSDGVDWPDVDQLGPLDFLYIRRPVYASKGLRRFLREFRDKNPGSMVLYEIPTYPYDEEMKGINYPALLKDRFHRQRMKGLVDYIVDLSGRDEIFGIETLQIMNGVDLSAVGMRTPDSDRGSLNLLFIAFFSDWHAADRVIKGLAEYRRKRPSKEVVLHLAGEGDRVPSLRELAKTLGLCDEVVFHGYCGLDEMDKLYDRCDIAVASLGLHRIGVDLASTLKTREYLAKGVPFIYSGKIDVFVGHPVDFCLEVPADDSPIDIEEIVEFYERLTESEDINNLTKRIRAYAEERVGVDVAMRNVIGLLKKEYSDDE